VKEQGTHDELMAHKRFYRRLVEKQEGADDENQSDSRDSSRHGSDIGFDHGASTTASAIRQDIVPHIEFKNVSFSYPSRPSKSIFEGFNLVIEQGHSIALVGPSGGGKTTTLGLLERFYDPTEGQVLYLGQDVKNLNVGWYRSQLSFVGQEPTLFKMSIADNIAFGAGDVSRTAIEEAARLANAHDFIMSFPDGYDTEVGGHQVSGGQKQR